MAYNANRANGARKNFGANRNERRNNRPTFFEIFKEQNPEITALSNFIRTSHEFKRHTSLALIKLLRDNGTIDEETGKVYINFQMTHYTIKADHLGRDMSYNDIIVVKAVMAALISVVAQGNRIINDICSVMLNEPLNESMFAEKETQAEISSLAQYITDHINNSDTDANIEVK